VSKEEIKSSSKNMQNLTVKLLREVLLLIIDLNCDLMGSLSCIMLHNEMVETLLKLFKFEKLLGIFLSRNEGLNEKSLIFICLKFNHVNIFQWLVGVTTNEGKLIKLK
jgi:hypothetical protein